MTVVRDRPAIRRQRLIMQSLCRVYAAFAQFMQSLYGRLPAVEPLLPQMKFFSPLHRPSVTFGPVVVVRSANTTVSFALISSITGPVFFEPDCRSALTMRMQLLHKLALHHVGQGDSMTASDPHKNLVELLVVVTILEVLEMHLLLPRNACTPSHHYANASCKKVIVQCCIRLPVRCAAHWLILPFKCGFFL